MSNGGRFVLIDRDGPILAHRSDYTKTKDEVLIMPFVPEALLALKSRSISVVIYHHEKGVAEGALDADTVSQLNNHMVGLLEENTDPDIIAGVISTDTPTDGLESETKVKAGLILRAMQNHGFNLKETWVVGDEEADVEAAHVVGARSCLVRVGRGHQTVRAYAAREGRNPDLIGKDIFALVNKLSDPLG